ncbi:glycosyl transferase [Halanaerobium saccharolyticum subsp. saccharolyticum DSM 6643]|uniref:Glycosyl transferase n=1 Tax=Halanaerobium saccharolyticum subsp. saccharolyticum DSM 6643 TaxID=1293054 RepID=M5EHK2_9FIRM|nr:glycosyltransferase family 4 protein [Halanaerobium saccharolyticum]CCU80943.1 glycosyl transferase [Halanaerobium saccharolyticum subsp. saccharolyticum DSM 6643]
MKNISIFTGEISESSGGIQNMAYNIYNKLKEDYNIKCFSEIENKNLKDDCIFYASSKENFISRKYTLLKKSLRFRNDLNISLTPSTAVIPYLLKKKNRTPYIVFIHGNQVYSDKKNLKYFVKRILLKNASLIISNSSYTKEKCKQNYGDNLNISIINPPINYKEIQYDTEINKNKKILFTVSRLEQRKGIHKVIESLPKILKKYPNLKYKIAGKGNYKNTLVRLTKELNLENAVEFLGFITEEEKDYYLKEMDLFVMPSYEVEDENSVEGFGIVYLEANMYGKFVIGGNSGGVTDAIIPGKTGFLVDGKNPNAIADRVIYFFDSYNNKYQYEKNCIKWAKEHDISIYIRKLNNYINDIL